MKPHIYAQLLNDLRNNLEAVISCRLCGDTHCYDHGRLRTVLDKHISKAVCIDDERGN